MSDPARVLEDALHLEPAERARVARLLIASLDDTTDDDADELWRDEIRTRIDAVEAGTVGLFEWADVYDRLRAKPAER
jgi:hypothetical protein